MPNIFKSFLKPAASKYVFPDAEELQVGEVAEEAAEEAGAPEEPEQDRGAEARLRI